MYVYNIYIRFYIYINYSYDQPSNKWWSSWCKITKQLEPLIIRCNYLYKLPCAPSLSFISLSNHIIILTKIIALG